MRLTGAVASRTTTRVLPAPVSARYIRYVHGHIGGAHLAVAELRVFGNAGGKAPGVPAKLSARRNADPRDAHRADRFEFRFHHRQQRRREDLRRGCEAKEGEAPALPAVDDERNAALIP